MFPPNIIPALSPGKPSEWPTDKAVKAGIAAYVATFWPLIRRPTIGSDTAKFLTTQPISLALEAELRNTNRNPKPPVFDTRAMQYYKRIDAQEPTETGLIDLADEDPSHLANGMDPAIDLPTDNSDDAALVARGFRLTMTTRWPDRDATTKLYKNSFYFAQRKTKPTPTARKTRRNLDVYIRDDGTTVRIEMRYFSARTLKKRGVRRSTDLLYCDFIAIIDVDCRFSAINPRKVAAGITEAARNYVQFVTADDPLSPVTVAAAEELIWDEVAAARDSCRRLDEFDDSIRCKT